MKVLSDNTRFDELQRHMLNEIVASIRDALREAGVSDEHVLHDATGGIAFSVAAIIDGSRVMNMEGTDVVPVLTFANESDGQELIGAESGGSWMHEYALGVVDELFEGENDGELDESIGLDNDDER